ncbi:hypothetical protein SteCoe_16178 [Stentor coeruleus]|uniref:Uncharacterized protein n=1 Tax=Stentor coeruleus TaxID=5963 RepID=A0A1R2C1R8_9CILI|nr:hypothetical protein SteCoe_16178 [Stentor coeruleus]
MEYRNHSQISLHAHKFKTNLSPDIQHSSVSKNGPETGKILKSLIEVKSEGNFYKDFRQKTNVIVRVLRDKAKGESMIKKKLDALKNIEKIKSQNRNSADFWNKKKEYEGTIRSLSKTPLLKTNSPKVANKGLKAFKKRSPVILSSYRFDSNVIPQCRKELLSLEELDLYLRSRYRSSRYG